MYFFRTCIKINNQWQQLDIARKYSATSNIMQRIKTFWVLFKLFSWCTQCHRQWDLYKSVVSWWLQFWYPPILWISWFVYDSCHCNKWGWEGRNTYSGNRLWRYIVIQVIKLIIVYYINIVYFQWRNKLNFP